MPLKTLCKRGTISLNNRIVNEQLAGKEEWKLS